MTEIPILFNTEMVQAILEDRKTQTRRICRIRSIIDFRPIDHAKCITVEFPKTNYKGLCANFHDEKGDYLGASQAPAHPGDTLWVRETWKQATTGTAGPGLTDLFLYKADEPQDTTGMMVEDRWHPSIHMPRRAARIFLKVTAIRTERLQDMTEDDAFAEGYDDGWPWCYHKVFENYPDSPIPCVASDGRDCPADRPCDHSIPELFGREIWGKTIKPVDLDKYGWDANPWVWAIEFERTERR